MVKSILGKVLWILILIIGFGLVLIFTAWHPFSMAAGGGDKVEITVQDIRIELKEISELSTYEGEYTVSLSADETRTILGGIKLDFATNSIAISADGVVKVGYDFSKIGVKIEESTIYITLPEAQINDNYIIWNTVECNEKNNIFNPIEFEQYQQLISEMEQKGLEDAEARGIYISAEDSIKNIISTFLSKFEGYEIVFE